MWRDPRFSHESDALCTQRNLFAWSLLAGLLLLAALAGPFFARRVYTRDDLGGFHLPTRAFYARQLARGEPFDWMPELYCGFYLTGEGQAGTYHPLHRALYRCLPLRAALGWEYLIPYPVMLAGTWFFLRRRLRRRDAAMLGSLLFTFSGFNLLHFVHPNAVAVVAHLPWLLWAIDVMLTDADRRKVAWAQAAIALLTGSQLLLGHPQSVWFSLLTEALYAIFVSANRRSFAHRQYPRGVDCAERMERAGGRWARLAVAKGCGLLLAGIQLLPTADALAQSTRHWAGASFANFGSLHPLNLVQLVAPYLSSTRVVGQNTHELGLYAGAVPLMLVVWVIAGRQRLARLKPLAWAAGGFGLLALLLAFGEYGPLYRLQRCLPLVGSFRFPCRYLVLFHLATAVMAAVGFTLLVRDYRRSRRRPAKGRSENRLLSPRSREEGPGVRGLRIGPKDLLDRKIRRWRMPWRRFGTLWAVVAVSAAAALAGLVWQHQPWTASLSAVLAGPLLLATAAVLVALAANGVRFAPVGLILFAAADLGAYGMSYAVYPKTDRLEHFIATAETPPTDRQDRVITSPLPFDQRGPRTGNLMVLAGWPRADGYAGLEPRRLLDYRRLAALRTAGVRWVRRSQAADQIEGLICRGPHWLEVPRPLPRVRLVGRARPSHDPARDIQSIPIESTALAQIPPGQLEGTPGTATIVSQRPGRLHVQCDCPGPQLLVVSESFHHGWQATVDGRPQQVFRVNGDFMGCRVGPGKQQVVLEFRPRSLLVGRILSYLGLGLVFCCLAADRLVLRFRHV